MELPDYTPVGVKWIKAPWLWKSRKIPVGTTYPPIKKYKEFLVLDEYRSKPLININKDEGRLRIWFQIQGGMNLKIWKKEDHPNLKLLPENAPRAVKKLYYADYQLAYLRMTDCLSYLNDADLARKKWTEFNRVKQEKEKENTMYLKKTDDLVDGDFVSSEDINTLGDGRFTVDDEGFMRDSAGNPVVDPWTNEKITQKDWEDAPFFLQTSENIGDESVVAM